MLFRSRVLWCSWQWVNLWDNVKLAEVSVQCVCRQCVEINLHKIMSVASNKQGVPQSDQVHCAMSSNDANTLPISTPCNGVSRRRENERKNRVSLTKEFVPSLSFDPRMLAFRSTLVVRASTLFRFSRGSPSALSAAALLLPAICEADTP